MAYPPIKKMNILYIIIKIM